MGMSPQRAWWAVQEQQVLPSGRTGLLPASGPAEGLVLQGTVTGTADMAVTGVGRGCSRDETEKDET